MLWSYHSRKPTILKKRDCPVIINAHCDNSFILGFNITIQCIQGSLGISNLVKSKQGNSQIIDDMKRLSFCFHEKRGLSIRRSDEEKGCCVRDLLTIGSCRAENLVSNDINYCYNRINTKEGILP